MVFGTALVALVQPNNVILSERSERSALPTALAGLAEGIA